MQIAREDESLVNVSFDLEEEVCFWKMFKLGKSLLDFFLFFYEYVVNKHSYYQGTTKAGGSLRVRHGER